VERFSSTKRMRRTVEVSEGVPRLGLLRDLVRDISCVAVNIGELDWLLRWVGVRDRERLQLFNPALPASTPKPRPPPKPASVS
jgi:hypothetical protein